MLERIVHLSFPTGVRVNVLILYLSSLSVNGKIAKSASSDIGMIVSHLFMLFVKKTRSALLICFFRIAVAGQETTPHTN
jgi:hypothetical protein